jgi:ASC-1-like (ASCH) protein
MDHLAIMNKSWKLIPKIISGEKSIESRWYQMRCAPWNKISKGDRIFFKNSGEAVTAAAAVSKVKKFTIVNLKEAKDIIKKYGREICLVNDDPSTWKRLPKYCVLIWLIKPELLKEPFLIDKTGFGSAAAWLSVKNISQIKR